MGFLDDFVDSAFAALTPDAVGGSRYWKRGETLMRSGERAQGRIVGIEVEHHDAEDRKTTLALEVGGRNQQGPVGTRFNFEHEHRLRLGMPVPLRTDGGDRAVVDWPALTGRWGLPEGSAVQRSVRSAPAAGVRDTSLDWRVKRRLKRGTPARATITAMERRWLMGMPTRNWDVELRLPGGSATRDAGQVIPFYAGWLAAPGAEVPLALDPEDRSKASVDWAAAAGEAAGRAGGMDDAPPPGSVAETFEKDSARAPEPAAHTSPDAVTADPDLAAIEGVPLELWAEIQAGFGLDRVRPADHDAYAAARGVPAGRWKEVDAAWQARMVSDWRVGARVGEAITAARKRR